LHPSVACSIVIAVLVLASLPLASSAAGAGSGLAQACTEYVSNPVLNDTGGHLTTSSTGTSFVYDAYYSQPFVMKGGSGYIMWVAAEIDNVSGIYRADSVDGLSWKVQSSPALPLGPALSWDSGNVYSPSVVWNGTTYLMYFTGNNATVQSRAIGVAFSSDGLHWKEYRANPVVVGGPGVYDAYYVRFPSVVLQGGTYRMWYTGHYPTNSTHPTGWEVDYATSADGVHWAKYSGNPVFTGNGTQYAYLTEHPSVVVLNSTYVMTFDDNGVYLYYAASTDGVRWTPSEVPLVAPAAKWDNDSVYFPSALVDGTQMLVWFYGVGGSLRTSASPYTAGVGLAYCNLVPVEVTQTVTSTKTSTLVVSGSATVTTVSTTITQSGGKVLIPAPAPVYLYAAVLVLVLVGVIAAVLAASRRNRTQNL